MSGLFRNDDNWQLTPEEPAVVKRAGDALHESGSADTVGASDGAAAAVPTARNVAHDWGDRGVARTAGMLLEGLPPEEAARLVTLIADQERHERRLILPTSATTESSRKRFPPRRHDSTPSC